MSDGTSQRAPGLKTTAVMKTDGATQHLENVETIFPTIM